MSVQSPFSTSSVATHLFLLAGALLGGGCAGVDVGNVHAHPGPGGGEWAGHIANAQAARPALRDTDGDGLPDRFDNCPKTAGTAANRGCAQAQVVEIAEGKLSILDKVYFQTGQAVIEERSFALLDQVAAVLAGHDEIVKLAVEGHTDNVGDAASNKELSQRRAEAVCTYLSSKGVAVERLTAVGMGQEKPIAENESEDGRAQNRRVEFKILDLAAERDS